MSRKKRCEFCGNKVENPCQEYDSICVGGQEAMKEAGFANPLTCNHSWKATGSQAGVDKQYECSKCHSLEWFSGAPGNNNKSVFIVLLLLFGFLLIYFFIFHNQNFFWPW